MEHETCSRRGSGAPAPWRLRARMGSSCAQLGSRCLVLACSVSYTAVLSRSARITLLGLCLLMMLQLRSYLFGSPSVRLLSLQAGTSLAGCAEWLAQHRNAASMLPQFAAHRSCVPPFSSTYRLAVPQVAMLLYHRPLSGAWVPDCAWQKAWFLQRLDAFLLLLLQQLLA